MRRPRVNHIVSGMLVASAALATARHTCAQQQQPSSPPAQAHITEARAALDAGNPPAAEAVLRAALAANPASAESHFLLGFALFREIQTHAADAADLTDTARHLHYLSFKEGNARASLAQFTEGARYGRPSAFDLKIVALDYVLLDDQADADKWLSKSLEWNGTDEQAWYYEGRIRYKEAHYPEAAQAFTRALQLNARDIAAEENLGLAEDRMGKPAEALAALQEAVTWAEAAHSPDDAPWVDLGDVLTQHNRAAEAVPYLTHAIAMQPQDLRAHEMLAAADRSLQHWPEAAAELEKATTLSPDEASLHFMLGQAYRRTGQNAKAAAEMQRSATLEAQGEAAARGTAAHPQTQP